MILEQVRLNPVGGVAVNARLSPADDDVSRAPRLPRWTRQEIMVLIQGKRVAETQVRRGRTAAMEIGSGPAESKWASVSSYCKRHGVNREPIQCRKRWSNLSGDYRKIKDWEARARDGTESFWVMRSDLRRERRLPGFFDREVYDILDGAPGASLPEPILALATPPPPAAKEEVVFDSGRSAAEEEGLFSDQEDGDGSPLKEIPALMPMPISYAAEKQYRPIPRLSQAHSDPRPSPSQAQGTPNQKLPFSAPEIGSTSQDGRKRKRVATDGDEEATSLQCRLVDLMERNGKMLNAQLEAQVTNFQLEQEQRKDHTDSLVAVLSKLADAMEKIADKL